MAETISQSQVLAAKQWRAPAEYVAYRMKVSAADAEALVGAVYAREEFANGRSRPGSGQFTVILPRVIGSALRKQLVLHLPKEAAVRVDSTR
jgi:hypothetical protein